MRAERAHPGRRVSAPERVANVPTGTEKALNVVVIYQDQLTRHWAMNLWDRVGQLIDQGGVGCKWWRVGDLTQAGAFAEAAQAAVLADVLVVSVRDGREMPLLLHVWADAWLPRRDGRTGALVAVIGLTATPDVLSGRAHEYLEGVARQAGLDFLPRERILPQEPRACAAHNSLEAASCEHAAA